VTIMIIIMIIIFVIIIWIIYYYYVGYEDVSPPLPSAASAQQSPLPSRFQLALNASTHPELGDDVKELHASVERLGDAIVRLKITDAGRGRWEVRGCTSLIHLYV
jgi:hypothetical protein